VGFFSASKYDDAFLAAQGVMSMGKPELNRLGRYGTAFLMGNFAAIALIVVPGKWNVLVYLVFMLCAYVLCEYLYKKVK
jgi:hypothetical protein